MTPSITPWLLFSLSPKIGLRVPEPTIAPGLVPAYQDVAPGETIRLISRRDVSLGTKPIRREVVRNGQQPETSPIRVPDADTRRPRIRSDPRAHESKTVLLQIPPDYDFLLHRVSCRLDGPVLLKIQVVQPPDARHPDPQTSQPITTVLDAEYPGHLAALVGESLEEWTQKNAQLSQRARAGDDQAFFDLIGRDPRVVGSQFTIAKVVSWRRIQAPGECQFLG